MQIKFTTQLWIPSGLQGIKTRYAHLNPTHYKNQTNIKSNIYKWKKWMWKQWGHYNYNSFVPLRGDAGYIIWES